jgi:hypothetical protein
MVLLLQYSVFDENITNHLLEYTVPLLLSFGNTNFKIAMPSTVNIQMNRTLVLVLNAAVFVDLPVPKVTSHNLCDLPK